MDERNTIPTMISVETALSMLTANVVTMPPEEIGIDQCTGRILADAVFTDHTQPPFAAAAMDGYAVRFADMAEGASLTVIGEAPAGTPFSGTVDTGQAVRIFTGAPVPAGADHVLIQEHAVRSGDIITVTQAQAAPRHIRPAGLDFSAGDCLAQKGTALTAFHGAVFAAGNVAWVQVYRQPRVMFFTNGDELVPPGKKALTPGEIVDANPFGLGPLITQWGGLPTHLGCVPDDLKALTRVFERAYADGADIVVPVGGASVGDHDHVKRAFALAHGALVFSKIAVKPGKPTWFGHTNGAAGKVPVIGLPGNPASAMVTAHLFLRPLIAAMGGQPSMSTALSGLLTAEISANGQRETFLRASAVLAPAGWQITPAPNQDSALILPFATCNALVRRMPGAKALSAGASVQFTHLH
ncbi:MAG: gephyrin-like molybdotransferase Glp [Pseudomonadota bacterium]